MGKETDIEQAAVDFAEKNQGIALKLNNAADSGWPDRQFISPFGCVFWIEFKQLGEKCKRLQSHRICELIEHGCKDVYVIDKIEDAKNVIKEYFRLPMGSPPIPRARHRDHDKARRGGPTVGSGAR